MTPEVKYLIIKWEVHISIALNNPCMNNKFLLNEFEEFKNIIYSETRWGKETRTRIFEILLGFSIASVGSSKNFDHVDLIRTIMDLFKVNQELLNFNDDDLRMR